MVGTSGVTLLKTEFAEPVHQFAVASFLHDPAEFLVGQALAASGPDGTGELGRLAELLEASVNHAYRLSHGLWPVERGPEGAWAALAELAHREARASGLDIRFKAVRPCLVCAHSGLPTFYRVAQEAVANAVRHARAGVVEVRLECSPGAVATLTVRDDGVGRAAAAHAAAGGLGLRMMAHCARTLGGTFGIRDGEPVGTLVTCEAPCWAWEDRP